MMLLAAPCPRSVSDLATATSSLYVPAQTTTMSPAEAALMAVLMVVYAALVQDVSAPPDMPVGDT